MTLALARIEEVGKPENGGDVMFNPVSLKVSVTNKVQNEESGGGGKGSPKQSPQPSTAKLEMELIFDTTEDGVDVRSRSSPITRLAISAKSDKVEPPKNLTFTWGRFKFSGIMESLNATYDFWSAEGVPLRATLQVTLTSLDGIGSTRDVSKDSVKISYGTAPPNGALSTVIAQLCGEVDAARKIAADNGLESMRMGNSGSGGGDTALAVGGSINLMAAAGFSAGAAASAGIGFGIGATASAGAGMGISAGAGLSAGAGIGFGTSAGAGIGFGASAGAGITGGVGASAGAFAGAGAGTGAFASAGASAGAFASAGAGAGAFAGARASAGAFAGPSAFTGTSSGSFSGASTGTFIGTGSFSGPAFGGSASAGVWAGGGAFAGLGMSKQAVLGGGRLDPSRLLASANMTTVGSGARFDITGRLLDGGSMGLSVTPSGVRVW